MEMRGNNMNKIVIIGCGNVGMSYAYALLNQKVNIDSLVLIDVDNNKADGEVMDLNHTLPYSPNSMSIKRGDYKDCNDADIIMISAGANQEPKETRLDLINKNDIIFKNIIDEVMKTKFKGIFLIATNPVDAMSYITYKYSKLDANKVIGTGTSLDTARLRYLLSKKFSINPKNVHAYVMGEHGDSEFIAWSTASIGTIAIKDSLSEEEKEKIAIEVRDSAYDIISKKGNTSYGIGACLVRITNAILNNENAIITVSTYDMENDVYISIPCVINKDGIKERLKINLETEEKELLANSTKVIKDTIKKSIYGGKHE